MQLRSVSLIQESFCLWPRFNSQTLNGCSQLFRQLSTTDKHNFWIKIFALVCMLVYLLTFEQKFRLLLLLLLLKLYLFTLTPSAVADFQGGHDNKKKTIYINTNKDSKQVRC